MLGAAGPGKMDENPMESIVFTALGAAGTVIAKPGTARQNA